MRHELQTDLPPHAPRRERVQLFLAGVTESSTRMTVSSFLHQLTGLKCDVLLSGNREGLPLRQRGIRSCRKR